MDGSDYIPPQKLVQALTKARATCQGCSHQIEYLEQLASVAPEIEQDVQAARVMHDHLLRLTQVGLNNKGTLEQGQPGNPT